MRPSAIVLFMWIALAAGMAGSQKPAASAQKSQTVSGCIGGNATDGFTLLSTKPAKDPKAANKPTYYSLVLPDGKAIDLVTMQNQRVEVIGVPEVTKDKLGRQRLTIREIKIVPGGC
jgi:hypothetical protein